MCLDLYANPKLESILETRGRRKEGGLTDDNCPESVRLTGGTAVSDESRGVRDEGEGGAPKQREFITGRGGVVQRD